MCGIFGYVGRVDKYVDVPGMTLKALRRLEYRGYDSWGIAVRNGKGIEVEKHTGKIGQASTILPASTIGFGHTRWATHGGVTEPNAHPHQDESRRVSVIHNGIVENYLTLKAGLIARGHIFRSETDTEVIVHLVEEALAHRDNPQSDLTWAVRYAFQQLDGLNAVRSRNSSPSRASHR
jgi:glucosamine--fructose-6-phosphate aminotransferase (isomerizing)